MTNSDRRLVRMEGQLQDVRRALTRIENSIAEIQQGLVTLDDSLQATPGKPPRGDIRESAVYHALNRDRK